MLRYHLGLHGRAGLRVELRRGVRIRPRYRYRDNPLALAFTVALAAINLRGVSESVKANVLLTCVELSGLSIVIVVGL